MKDHFVNFTVFFKKNLYIDLSSDVSSVAPGIRGGITSRLGSIFSSSKPPMSSSPPPSSSSSSHLPDDRLKVNVVKKEESEFDGIFQCQRLGFHDGPVWVLEFSVDGSYLASGGQDGRIMIWRVLGSNPTFTLFLTLFHFILLEIGAQPPKDSSSRKEEEKRQKKSENEMEMEEEEEEILPEDLEGRGEGEYKLLSPAPIQILDEHEGDVIDLSWSRTNFLLSASIDKTVRFE